MLALLLGASALAQASRDPFARPAAPAPAPAEAQAAAAAEPAARPQLRAIMTGSGQALANISGRILAVGEWFGDYRVVRIRERSVTLVARGGARSELALDQVSEQ
jgi:hypothetical protein